MLPIDTISYLFLLIYIQQSLIVSFQKMQRPIILYCSNQSLNLFSYYKHDNYNQMKKYSENQMSYTSNSFSRQNSSSYFDREDAEPEIHGYDFDVEELKSFIQNQVFKGLLTIKGEIQTKIKQIDKDIKDLKQNISSMNHRNQENKISELEQAQFEIVQKIKQIMQKNQTARVPPLVRNQSRRSIDRSGYLNQSRDRQSSKDRKPIFMKPEINLSTVLFPFSQNQEPAPIMRQDKPLQTKNKYNYHQSQTIQQLNSLIINDIHQSPFQIPLSLSSGKKGDESLNSQQLEYQQKIVYISEKPKPIVEGLVTNKTKFLKKKSSEDLRRDSQYSYEKDKFKVIEEQSMEESLIRR